MSIFRASTAAIFGIAMTSAAFGRIGETKEQCVERYGEVVGTRDSRLAKSDGEADVFKMADIEVVVEYRAGKAWMISYFGRKMNQTNAEKILAAYGEDAGAKWGAYTKFSDVTHWNDTRGGRHAVLYGSPQLKLVVFDKSAVAATYKPVVFISELEEKPAEGDEAEKADEEADDEKPEEAEKADPFSGF